jgi:DNA/RNA endonuclease G (NUC1)/PKD repeat protein
VTTTFTWAAETNNVSVDQNGVITALAPGDATIRATSANGATSTYTLPFRVAVASTTAQYAGNAEFGEPADADASDDYVLRHTQYTSSYSRVRNTPNWVSYNLDPSHFGSEDRCDCFTFDPGLPVEFAQYTTADYTGAGTFHGYGIDRGHLARSFDRTSASFDNATTFYFSNIIPQAADLNQGPWAIMENYLGDLARNQNREVYIVAGVAGSKGTLKNEGKITIPENVWKVAVILPRDKGLDDIKSYQDLEVIAVVMPNKAGVRNVDWQSYKTTVDAVEALSGYDLLAKLPNQVEIAVESGTKPPTALLDGPYTGAEGASISMSAAASSDPDGDALTYSWTFGDGTSATGESVSHTYAQDGSYTVQLVVTDSRGLMAAAMATAKVTNVAPVITPLAGATLLPGETYTGTGSFQDPGADDWSATVDYGDGSAVQTLALADGSFSLSHRYTTAGAHTVTVTITDDDVSSMRMATIVVKTPAQAVDDALDLVAQLESHTGGVNWRAVSAPLQSAGASLERGNRIAASGQLTAAANELDAIVRSGRVTAAAIEPLDTLIGRVIRSIS